MNSRTELKLLTAVAVATGLLATVPAEAEYSSYEDFARVVSAEPVFATVEHQVPRQQCWDERVQTHSSHYPSHHRSATPTLVGALVGGALGNELGHHKRNKQVGAVIGAVLGGSIARDVQRRHHDHHEVSYHTERRCETVYDVETEEQVIGYHVEYRYKGHDYETRTRNHPGKRLRVNVAVTPAE